MSYVRNPQYRPAARFPLPGDAPWQFHRQHPDYAITPLVTLPSPQPERFRLLAKDERHRLGLPAFKILGASYAVERYCTTRSTAHPLLQELTTATDGNHGRGVARVAATRGLACTVFVPRVIDPAKIAAIRSEEAHVIQLDADYDAAVEAASTHAATTGALLVQDTAWPGYDEIPGLIVDGYATIFLELAEQLTALERTGEIILLIPNGVGSLAQAAVVHAREFGWQVMIVDPETAACGAASFAAGSSTTVATTTTTMAGLNCPTLSMLAWPILRDGCRGALTVSDADCAAAQAALAAAGYPTGATGAAATAAVGSVAAALDPEPAELPTVITFLTEAAY